MAPGLTSDTPIASNATPNGHGKHGKAFYPEPLEYSGALDKFGWEDATPVIGREFPTLNIVDDLLNASNADELVRDLAITSKYLIKTETDYNANKSVNSLAARSGVLPFPRQSYQ